MRQPNEQSVNTVFTKQELDSIGLVSKDISTFFTTIRGKELLNSLVNLASLERLFNEQKAQQAAQAELVTLRLAILRLIASHKVREKHLESLEQNVNLKPNKANQKKDNARESAVLVIESLEEALKAVGTLIKRTAQRFEEEKLQLDADQKALAKTKQRHQGIKTFADRVSHFMASMMGGGSVSSQTAPTPTIAQTTSATSWIPQPVRSLLRFVSPVTENVPTPSALPQAQSFDELINLGEALVMTLPPQELRRDRYLPVAEPVYRARQTQIIQGMIGGLKQLESMQLRRNSRDVMVLETENLLLKEMRGIELQLVGNYSILFESMEEECQFFNTRISETVSRVNSFQTILLDLHMAENMFEEKLTEARAFRRQDQRQSSDYTPSLEAMQRSAPTPRPTPKSNVVDPEKAKKAAQEQAVAGKRQLKPGEKFRLNNLVSQVPPEQAQGRALFERAKQDLDNLSRNSRTANRPTTTKPGG